MIIIDVHQVPSSLTVWSVGMPGYRSLSTHLSGQAADHVREAEERQRDGNVPDAARLLEEALEASARTRPEIPGWLCGRLASIYRTLKRYDDEVVLLERYRDSQSSEDARTRFDARLSKARAIADRKRRPDTGDVATVRQVRDRAKGRRTPASSAAVSSATTRRKPPAPLIGVSTFAPALVTVLRHALIDDTPGAADRLQAVIARLGDDARVTDAPMESLVGVLKTTWLDTPTPPGIDDARWHERYALALVELLACYFGEEPRS